MVEFNANSYTIFCQKAKDIEDWIRGIEEDTSFSSALEDTVQHINFAKLIDMGTVIIPYIIYLMTQDGCNWTHLLLLRALVGNEMETPEEHQGRFVHIM